MKKTLFTFLLLTILSTACSSGATIEPQAGDQIDTGLDTELNLPQNIQPESDEE